MRLENQQLAANVRDNLSEDCASKLQQSPDRVRIVSSSSGARSPDTDIALRVQTSNCRRTNQTTFAFAPTHLACTRSHSGKRKSFHARFLSLFFPETSSIRELMPDRIPIGDAS